jgi:NADH dehydrogenase
MGVEVLLDTPIEAIDDHGVTAKGRRLEAANVIWCAGVEASPAARWLGVPAAKGGRVPVAPDLSVPGHPEIFVIGDVASRDLMASRCLASHQSPSSREVTLAS